MAWVKAVELCGASGKGLIPGMVAEISDNDAMVLGRLGLVVPTSAPQEPQPRTTAVVVDPPSTTRPRRKRI